MIVAATFRDLSYIAANMRAEDRAEMDAQLPGWDASYVAALHMEGLAYVAMWRDNPEAAFGASEARRGLWQAWSWGTKRMSRCLPAIIRFHRERLGPAVVDAGAYRVEARMLANNAGAERFLKALGATRRCELPGYGVNGQEFILYDWTRESWADVLLFTETAAAARRSASAEREHGRGEGA